jgi:Protein of unknown function (DUF3168)
MLRVMPDVVRILVSFLRAQPEVVALVGDNVRGELPPKQSFPAIRVTRIGSEPVVSLPHELDLVNVQLDVWGGNDRQAERLAAVVSALLTSDRLAPGYADDEGEIHHVRAGTFFGDVDDAMTPPRRRYVATFDLYVRPKPYPTS